MSFLKTQESVLDKVGVIGNLACTLIVVLIITRCAPNKSATEEKGFNKAELLTQFLDTIPACSLPITLRCGLPDSALSSRDFGRFQKIIPKSVDRIWGAINSSNPAYKLIIFGQTGDDIYPILFSFDNNGNVKDSVSLMLQACGMADESQIPLSFVSISNDLIITMTDTTRYIHHPEGLPSLDVYVVDSVNVSQTVLAIDHQGNFVRNKGISLN